MKCDNCREEIPDSHPYLTMYVDNSDSPSNNVYREAGNFCSTGCLAKPFHEEDERTQRVTKERFTYRPIADWNYFCSTCNEMRSEDDVFYGGDNFSGIPEKVAHPYCGVCESKLDLNACPKHGNYFKKHCPDCRKENWEDF